MEMICIDGSEGEGAGQILRTSLALWLVTARPFRMEHIRAKRQKPRLLRQHLTGAEAAKIVGCADVAGSEMKSQTLAFLPGPVTALEQVTGVFTGFAERGRRAEDVANEAVEAAEAWLKAEVPVDEYLADQLLLPMALAGGGCVRTTKPSLHSATNAAIIQRFLPVPIRFERVSDLVWKVTIGARN